MLILECYNIILCTFFSIDSVFIFPKLKGELTELTKHDSVEGIVHHTKNKLDQSEHIMYGPQNCFVKKIFFQNIRFGKTRG